MQTKPLNAYRITHKDGKIENINAENLIQALENTEETEADSPVIQTFMVREGVQTVVEELPTEILFTAVVAKNGGGSIATPKSGRVHVGDVIAFSAIPADGYEFVSWSRNGTEISKNASFVWEFGGLAEGEDTAVFTATFALAPVQWESEVSPAEAGGAGCVAFQSSGKAEVGSDLSLIAVIAEGWAFDHWERNGETVGTNKILETQVAALASGEEKAVYVAVFSAE